MTDERHMRRILIYNVIYHHPLDEMPQQRGDRLGGDQMLNRKNRGCDRLITKHA